MKYHTTLKAYIPFQTSYVENFETSLDMLVEICKLEGVLEFSFDLFGNVKPSLNLLSADEATKRIETDVWDEIFPKHQGIQPEIFLEITATISYEPSIEDFVDNHGNKVSMSLDGAIEYYRKWICAFFTKRIYDIALVANIAEPGSVGFGVGFVLQDGILDSKTDLMTAMQIQEAVCLAKSISWPILRKMNFLDVWQWATRQEGFLDGYGENQVTRALNALSYMFDQDIELQGPALFWALVGVESLYVTGESALTQQVREKSSVLLGAPVAYKKKLNNMYDYRSRLVHGDLNFPGRHNLREEQEGEFLAELQESIGLAIAILISTLQEIILRKWDGLKFAYTVGDINT